MDICIEASEPRFAYECLELELGTGPGVSSGIFSRNQQSWDRAGLAFVMSMVCQNMQATCSVHMQVTSEYCKENHRPAIGEAALHQVCAYARVHALERTLSLIPCKDRFCSSATKSLSLGQQVAVKYFT